MLGGLQQPRWSEGAGDDFFHENPRFGGHLRQFELGVQQSPRCSRGRRCGTVPTTNASPAPRAGPARVGAGPAAADDPAAQGVPCRREMSWPMIGGTWLQGGYPWCSSRRTVTALAAVAAEDGQWGGCRRDRDDCGAHAGTRRSRGGTTNLVVVVTACHNSKCDRKTMHNHAYPPNVL